MTDFKKILYIISFVLIILGFLGAYLFELFGVMVGLTIAVPFFVMVFIFIGIPLLIFFSVMAYLSSDTKIYFKRSGYLLICIFVLSVIILLIQKIILQKLSTAHSNHEGPFAFLIPETLSNPFIGLVTITILLSLTSLIIHFVSKYKPKGTLDEAADTEVLESNSENRGFLWYSIKYGQATIFFFILVFLTPLTGVITIIDWLLFVLWFSFVLIVFSNSILSAIHLLVYQDKKFAKFSLASSLIILAICIFIMLADFFTL